MNHRLPRITYVIDDLGYGGAQRQLYYNVRALAGAADLSVVVLSDLVDPHAARLRELGVRVEVIPRRTGLDLGRVLALARTFDELETDIAHAMLEGSDGYTFLAARVRRIPAVLSLRSDRLHSTRARARMLGWAMRHSPAVTVNSNVGRDYLVSGIGVRPERVCLVPNIVEVPPAANDRATSPLVIGAVGRLVEMKRFDSILEALPIVRRELPAARVVLVGDGPARPALEALARRNGIADAVQFTGAVDDAAPHIVNFGCIVIASTHEGLPNAALEALARGVPVVAVPAGDLPRVVKDGVTGIMARDASAPALADAVVRALTSPALRESAAREGPRLMREEFSPARARAELVELYARLARQ